MTLEPDIEAKLSAAHTKRGRLQRECLVRLFQHRDTAALPTSARFIYYELVQSRIIAKLTKKRKDGKKGRRSDQNTIEALTYLREHDIVPWAWLTDETRSMSVWRYNATVAGYLADTVDVARLDLWGGEPPPVIITESRSLAGVLENLAVQYLVPITSTNGQCRGHLHTDVAPILTAGQRVLYLGDFDWQGGQIESHTRSVLERLVGPLRWTRLAITAEQVQNADPPLPVIDKADNRYKPPRYHPAVETEALGQSFIVGIVREHLDALLPEPLESVQEREHHERVSVAAYLRRL